MRYLILMLCFFISGCFSESGEGQVIYNWDKENTGIAKFSRDHSECLKKAEGWFHWPNIASWFYSEEYRYNIHVDWHKEKGIWASYVPYQGATPVLVNSIRDTSRSDPHDYRVCMEDKGYIHRAYNLPTVTNIFVYKPQKTYDYSPFEKWNYERY